MCRYGIQQLFLLSEWITYRRRYGTAWQCFGSVFIWSESSTLCWIRIRIQGFDDQKLIKNLQMKKCIIIFLSKIAIYLSLGLHKGRPSYRKILQPSKKNIHHFKKHDISNFFYIFVCNFCPSGSGSGSGFLIRIWIRIHWPDWIRIEIPNPKHCCLEPYLYLSFLNNPESYPCICLRVAIAFHRLLFQVEHQRESGEPWWRQREPERRLGAA